MKTLVLGTCCLDLVMNVEKIPQNGTDLNANSMSLNMGGMAYNVYQAITTTGEDAILGCPAGEGPFSDIIEKFYEQRGVKPFARSKGLDNGVCLCLVDKNGERTFIAYHGAEYKFQKEWYKDVNFDEIDMIYFSGLEVEEDTGINLVEFLEEKQKPCLFAPSSRVVGIEKEVLERIYQLHPILHINEYEAEVISGNKNIEEAAEIIFNKTKAPVIVTLGEKGAYIVTDKEKCYVETTPVDSKDIVDSIGAGDGHAGAFIAGLKKGYSVKEACKYANALAKTVLLHTGAGVVI